jgi:hypothetical protein
MNNNTIAIVAIAAVAVMLIAASPIAADHAAYAKKKYRHHHHHSSSSKKTQTVAQANACGDGTLPLDIFCQALSNQIQGDDNAVNVIGVQPAPARA